MLRKIMTVGTGSVNRVVTEGVSDRISFLDSGPQSPQQDLQASPLDGRGES